MDNKKNILIVAVGVVLLIIGFFCLAQGPAENPVSLTVAPLVLVFAYIVVVPFGILWSGKKKKSD
jgi:membrane-bound ClpP family serine protease